MRIPTSHGHATYKILSSSLLSLTLLLSAQTCALSLGKPVADFSLPSASVNYGQRLSEQIGNPVMLLVLDRCSDCGGALRDMMEIATQYQEAGLVTWVIWTARAKDLPPKLPVPVLTAPQGWAEQLLGGNAAPAILLINTEGDLESLLLGSMSQLEKNSQQQLSTWMPSQRPPVSN